MSDRIAALIEAERLPSDYREIVEQYWRPLADEIARRAANRRPLIVGINGAQGSGKTTLCKFLEALLDTRAFGTASNHRHPRESGDPAAFERPAEERRGPRFRGGDGEGNGSGRGIKAVTLSLDDLYLSRADRAKAAGGHHPLFATRGVPGTHDIERGMAILDRLLAGQSAELPQFDKAADDRSPETLHVEGPVDVVLFEGWCVGAIPQPDAALAQPVNDLERYEDPHGRWRQEINRRLATDYAALFARLDLVVMLKVPDFEAVRSNRRLQEEKLGSGPAVMDEAALDRFLAHYQRLTEWMFAEMPARADVLVEIGRDQRPLRVSMRGQTV